MDVKSKKKPKNAKNPYPIKKSLPTTCYENSRSQLWYANRLTIICKIFIKNRFPNIKIRNIRCF
jgi:hypothetical protein